MKRPTNQEISNEITEEIFSELCCFYHSKMIHVPSILKGVILNKSQQVLDKYVRSKYAVKSLDELIKRTSSRGGKAIRVFEALARNSSSQHWTIKELSEMSGVSAGAVHKLKYRLLFLNILVMAEGSRTKFHVTEAGQKKLKKFA